MKTARCSGCHREIFALCNDCVEALKGQKCTVCLKPLKTYYNPYPVCEECEGTIEKDIAQMEKR